MKRYNLINNSLGWICFVIAAITYLLTLEPTASFWDCPEFILQAFKLEVGHPPGNPIFMLAARFFVNFVGGDVTKVALAVNSMSALLSAGTILLLFWTITHLTRRLVVDDKSETVSLAQMLVIFGAGVCGALAYTWSDTFWFSAVEGEVYAFSSFCTALVFWLILKWESRADNPSSDKYLVLIAYVIGISVAVHLLNLLCIPAIVLVVYYRKWANPTAKGSLIALLVSFAIVALILYGLVPGFIAVAQKFELFFVNTLHMSYNAGTLIYAILLTTCFVWAIHSLYRQKSANQIRLSFLAVAVMSGIFAIGHSIWVPLILLAILAVWLWKVKKLPVRILALSTLSIFVIFVGYSSYALLLIRSYASTPMNQNAPDNVFTLSSYLNREQYGDRPLIYGQTLYSKPLYEADASGKTSPVCSDGPAQYAKTVKTSPDQPDHYDMTGYKKVYKYSPELDMLFPRIYSSVPEHRAGYSEWIGFKGQDVYTTLYVDQNGNALRQEMMKKPTFSENLSFFVTYQLNHMYWRYFMWNFAGRQNDLQGNGEVNRGNWISGIPFIDNARLGDQSLLPYDEGEGNAGHNVFYMLPLILGLIGLGWQSFCSKRGIEQFWVVFFLFFMTGIAIVIYLNQTPGQPRERDYAFAGSFYAYAIWIGLGVAGLWRLLVKALPNNAAAATAAIIGVLVPLQMVSQTWDDHDRSGRYTARDFGMNYLNSLDDNAIIFTNGDNDTFPLWYAQEVEGTRTDVKVVNLSYLTTDWYVNQIIRPSYDAPGIKLLAKPADYAHDRLQYTYLLDPDPTPVPVLSALAKIYDPSSSRNEYGVPLSEYENMYIPVDSAVTVASGRLTPEEAAIAEPAINISFAGASGLTLSQVMAMDMLASSVADGWTRPVYFAMTVPRDYYMGMSPQMRLTGLTYEVSPLDSGTDEPGVNTEKMYRNVTERFRWGGIPEAVAAGKSIYLDETVRRMVITNRSALVDLAAALYNEGVALRRAERDANSDTTDSAFNCQAFDRAIEVLDLLREKLPESVMPYSFQIGQQIGDLYTRLGEVTKREDVRQKGLDILRGQLHQYAARVRYYQSLSPDKYRTLSRTDRYIDANYLLDLIETAYQASIPAEEIEDIVVQQEGVNLSRYQ